MKNNWKIKTLGDVCDFRSVTHKGSLPYVGMEDVESHTGKYLGSFENREVKSSTSYFDTSCVLYGKLRPYLNKVLLPNFEGHCSTEFLTLRPTKALSREWLFRWLTSNNVLTEMSRRVTGTRMPRADLKHLKFLEIPIPDLVEQKRIVKILDEKFEAIEELKKVTEQQIIDAKELFESRLNEVFDNNSNWKMITVSEVGQVQTGNTPKTSERGLYGNYIPFIKPADIDYDGIGSVNYKNEGLSVDGFKVSRKISSNSILMVCIGATITKVGFSTKEITTNQQINSLTPSESFYAKFFYYTMRTRAFKIAVISKSSQATLPIINKTSWSNIFVRFPDLKKQKQIVKELDELSEKTKGLEAIFRRKIADLEELKKSYLEQAFAGKL